MSGDAKKVADGIWRQTIGKQHGIKLPEEKPVMDIDKMEAGPEMDRMVAEKVMGWTRIWVRGWDTGYFIGGHYADEAECGKDCLAEPRGRTLDTPKPIMLWSNDRGCTFGKGVEWSPSKKIAEAWEVLEKMWLQGLLPTVRFLRKHESVWQADFWSFGVGAWAQADTAPHAICVAALKATESLKEAK